jgi:hypothetical protein
MYKYQVFQLNIISALAFPELCSLSHESFTRPDIAIDFGPVSTEGLSSPLKKGVCFQAKAGLFWLHVPKVARFLVAEGNQITIDPISGADEDSMRVFVLGSCMGALLIQRGLFLLHGNAIRVNGHAVAFTGLSGVGKSTLAGIFLKRGYSMLTDEVCALDAQGRVIPGFPGIQLWADVIKQLEMDKKSLRKIRPNIEKYTVSIEKNFHGESSPLKMIYVLSSHNKSEVNIKNISGIEKFQLLRFQSYRLPYVEGLSQENRHKKRCMQLIGSVGLARLARPNHGYGFDLLADYVESDLAKRNLTHE